MNRINEIIEQLKRKKKLYLSELCEFYFCSPATIRRDFDQLEKMNIARRIRGGIIINDGPSHEYTAQYRTSINREKKESICNIAVDFISNGMSIFLDASSTALKLCEYLDSFKNLSVLTNGIDAALRLNDLEGVDTFMTGGYLKKSSHNVLGKNAEQFVNGFAADIAFISCRGIDEKGIYEADILQKEIKNVMMNNARTTILLVDSTKFNHIFFHHLCEFNRISTIITDQKPSEDFISMINSTDCELIY